MEPRLRPRSCQADESGSAALPVVDRLSWEIHGPAYCSHTCGCWWLRTSCGWPRCSARTGGGRLRRRRRHHRPGRAVAGQRVRLRRDRAGRDAARRWTASRCAGGCASPARWSPVLMLTARDARRRPGPGPGRRRRRLPDQAVQLRRAGRPGPGADPPRWGGAARPCCTPATCGSTRRRGERGAGEDELELSTKEFALLELFLRHPGQVLTRTRILEHVWDFAYDGVSQRRRPVRAVPAPQDRPPVRAGAAGDRARCGLPAARRRPAPVGIPVTAAAAGVRTRRCRCDCGWRCSSPLARRR